VIEKPNGGATVETYTVVLDRRGKRFGIVVGRDSANNRFLAHTPDDDQTPDWMMREEILGRHGTVAPGEVTNLFRFT
jgi:acetyl-CoA C-acetyltransferase